MKRKQKVNTVEKSRKQEHFQQRGKQRANEVAAGKIQKIQRESFFNSTKSFSPGAKEARKSRKNILLKTKLGCVKF